MQKTNQFLRVDTGIHENSKKHNSNYNELCPTPMSTVHMKLSCH